MSVRDNNAGNVVDNVADNVSGIVDTLPLAVFLVDGVASLRPSYRTIANTASYPNDDFEMVGSGAVGGKVFTRTAGDPASDAGTGTWWCVVEYTDTTLDFNVVLSASGDVFTLAHPFEKAVAKLHQGHQQNNGQHWSPMASAAAAEAIYNVTRAEAYFETSQYSLWPDDEFAQDSFAQLATNRVPRPDGGALNNSVDYVRPLNPWTGGNVIHSEAIEMLDQNAVSVGHGFTVDIQTNNKPCFLRTSLGGALDGATGLAEVLFDGVAQALPDNGNFGSALYSIKLPVPASVSVITYRAKRAAGSGAYHIRIGGIYLTDLSNVPNASASLINASSRVGLFGDSYFDNADANGAPFHNKFESLHGGFLSNRAIGASKISDWIANLQGWLDADNLDIAILHSGVNERNSGISRAAYWADVKQFVNICKANHVTPVVFTAGATASQSQTSDLFRQSAFDDVPYADRWPQQIGDWHIEATTSEIANTTSARINLYKKTAGKAITRLNDGATVTATGSTPSDAWS